LTRKAKIEGDMDDIFRSRMDIRHTGPLYQAVCFSCGSFVAASADVDTLQIAERLHHCDKNVTALTAISEPDHAKLPPH
jgi:hypothetical protein